MLYDYHFTQNFFNSEEIEILNDCLTENLDASIFQSPAENIVKSSIYTGVYVRPVREKLTKLFAYVNHINLNIFNFDIYQLNDFDTINYNVYNAKNNSEYGWHSDFPIGSSVCDFKLTVLVNLSKEKYEGGKFEIFLNCPRHIIEFDKPGTVLIFPSYLQHRVTPVTNGERISLSLWHTGPQLR